MSDKFNLKKHEIGAVTLSAICLAAIVALVSIYMASGSYVWALMWAVLAGVHSGVLMNICQSLKQLHIDDIGGAG